jgi:hypothetical protein
MTAVGPNSELTFWALMSAFTGCGHGRACCEDADAILFAPLGPCHDEPVARGPDPCQACARSHAATVLLSMSDAAVAARE